MPTFATYLKELAHGTTPDDVIDAYAEGLGWVFDWVIELGANKDEMSITEPATDPEGQNAEYHELENSYAFGYFAIGKSKDVEVKGPNHVQVFLEQAVAQRSDVVDYRTSTPLVDLVQDAETGAVTGVIAGEKKPEAHPRQARRHHVPGRIRAQSRDDAELPGSGRGRPSRRIDEHRRRDIASALASARTSGT